MSQSEQFHEAWAYCRDNAKPLIADDVWALAEIRADMPPSKAHVKRLLRERPTVTPARPHGTTCLARRRQINEADAHGARIAALLGKTPYKPDPPVRRAPVYIEPQAKGAGKVATVDKGLAARRAHMIAMSKMMYREYSPSHEQIIAVFGSLEAWSKAHA